MLAARERAAGERRHQSRAEQRGLAAAGGSSDDEDARRLQARDQFVHECLAPEEERRVLRLERRQALVRAGRAGRHGTEADAPRSRVVGQGLQGRSLPFGHAREAPFGLGREPRVRKGRQPSGAVASCASMSGAAGTSPVSTFHTTAVAPNTSASGPTSSPRRICSGERKNGVPPTIVGPAAVRSWSLASPRSPTAIRS